MSSAGEPERRRRVEVDGAVRHRSLGTIRPASRFCKAAVGRGSRDVTRLRRCSGRVRGRGSPLPVRKRPTGRSRAAVGSPATRDSPGRRPSRGRLRRPRGRPSPGRDRARPPGPPRLEPRHRRHRRRPRDVPHRLSAPRRGRRGRDRRGRLGAVPGPARPDEPGGADLRPADDRLRPDRQGRARALPARAAPRRDLRRGPPSDHRYDDDRRGPDLLDERRLRSGGDHRRRRGQRIDRQLPRRLHDHPAARPGPTPAAGRH